VPEGPAPSHLRAHLRIDHSWVGDLVAVLWDPAGSAVFLLDRPGDGLCDADGVDCVFDDGAARAAADECSLAPPAIGGEVRAVEVLDALGGESPAGQWALSVWDDVSGDTGAIVRWCVELR
jgi:subtilisin-like proprotein convertase family protein